MLQITSVPGGIVSARGLNAKEPPLVAIIVTVIVGGGVGVGVGLGVGLGVGVGRGAGVGVGLGVGAAVGTAVGVSVGVAVAREVAVGLTAPVVGEEPGVVVVPMFTATVGVVPVFALGDPPPQAETSASSPNNNKPNQTLSDDLCVLFGMISFFPNIPHGIDERDVHGISTTRKYCTKLHNKKSYK